MRRLHPGDDAAWRIVVRMGTTDFNSRVTEVPADDGAIGAALADLDQKLTTWTSEMDRMQVVLKRAVENVASSSVDTGLSPVAEASSVAPPGTASASTEADTSDTEGPAKVVKLPPRNTEVKTEGATVVEPQAPLVQGTPPLATPEPEACAEPAVAEEPKIDEDEALLATLDLKTARAIKIRRRLCNGSKSVRELLDEG